MSGKSDINERLQEIEDRLKSRIFLPGDFIWMVYAIKQLQEENEVIKQGEKALENRMNFYKKESEIAQKRIEELESTVKQLQEESVSLNTLVDKLEIGIKRQSVKHGEAKKRIEELEGYVQMASQDPIEY